MLRHAIALAVLLALSLGAQAQQVIHHHHYYGKEAPTASAVPQALAAGIPVIVTAATPPVASYVLQYVPTQQQIVTQSIATQPVAVQMIQVAPLRNYFRFGMGFQSPIRLYTVPVP